MTEVVLFNHIPKTAGRTIHEVLWRNVGPDRLLFATRIGKHREDIEEIQRRVQEGGRFAVAAHTGFGVHALLPVDCRQFTILRDPVARTISAFFYERDQTGTVPSTLTLEEYLKDYTARSYNLQTASMGGLTLRRHLDGETLQPDLYDGQLLETAKHNLENQEVVGLTERFDETLLVLREEFGWPLWRTLYRPRNIGTKRQPVSAEDIEKIRANNELDCALYEFGRSMFQTQLGDRQVRTYQRLNSAFGGVRPGLGRVARSRGRS